MSRATAVPCSVLLVVTLMLATMFAPSPVASGGTNATVMPPQSKPHGKTYGKWSELWWKWVIGIPAAENPGLDETGEFGHVDQSGPVWFLAGLFGSSEVERTVVVPPGKSIFFPLYNWVWWAPDDLETAAFVADHLGFTPEQIAAMTDEQLIRLVARYAAGTPELTLTVDGRAVRNPLQYYAESAAFRLTDTDLLDDFGIPISQPNLSVSAGYWIMLAPLSVGWHEIRWTVAARHSIPDFDVDMDVTYHIRVGRR